MCVDYCNLNFKTIKNRYSLLLIENLLNRLTEAAIFTQLDMKHAYHHLHIYKDNEWKTVFCISLELFEYIIVLFDLTNALTVFQSYINKTLCEYLDVFVMIYLDNIVIYFSCEKDHEKHVHKILKTLIKMNLYVKLSKCNFSTHKIDFLSYQVFTEEISMKSSQVETILSWLESEFK